MNYLQLVLLTIKIIFILIIINNNWNITRILFEINIYN